MILPYKFSPFLFLRSPTFSFEGFNIDNLPDILAQEFFQTALYFSSQDLYRQLKQRNFDTSRLSKGMEESLLRYYNRMCHRTTPFGMFSAFSHTKWAEEGEGLVFSGNESIHVQVDYRLSQHIVTKEISETMPATFYSNPSIYYLAKELRFIKTGRNGNSDSDIQGLSAVANSRFLSKVINQSKDGIGLENLKSMLTGWYPNMDPEVLIRELLSEEILISDFVPNVTGENYLKRIASLLDDERITRLVETLDSSKDRKLVNSEKMEDLIDPFLSGGEKIRSPFYVNYEKEVNGTLSIRYQADLLDGLSCLSRMQAGNDKTAISRFKKRFVERFEEQEVLLMIALDPEAGIGYEFLEATAENDEILKGLTFEEPEEPKQIAWGPLQEMLMNKLSLPDSTGIIKLVDEDLAELKVDKRPFSPGISVMFRLVEGKVFIESAGGTTATALVGRFTGFNETILAQVRSLAEAEQTANEEILFAEIAYATEEHASNINTRQHVRDYEIPVLVHSTLPNQNVIPLNDLYISVQRNEVVLRSVKLGRRIVPCLSSAYNHVRSELPVFRFLSDLQYQGIAAVFSLRPESLLPGRGFYPRIEYKNCILAAASWIIKKNEISKIRDVPSFVKFAKDRELSRYFALSESDKQLVFDLDDHRGLELLMSQIKNVDQVILREFFIEKGGYHRLADKSGNGYIHQFIAYLTNNTKTYFHDVIKRDTNKDTKRYVSPGDTWIYFKVYCNPQNANNILFSKIYPLIKRHRAKIDKWFYIRYYDPDHHLRVRIHGSDEVIMSMPRLFNTLLNPYVKSGIISKLQIDTYVREIERYGAKTIDQAEHVFHSSSDVVAHFLQGENDELEVIKFALISAEILFEAFNLDVTSKILLLEKITANLINEQGNEKQLRNDLNRKYREHQQLVHNSISGETIYLNRLGRVKMKLWSDEIGRLEKVLRKGRQARKDQLASDILHMHMNRIFSSDQRKKELVIYYLCLRFYISQKAREGSRLT